MLSRFWIPAIRASAVASLQVIDLPSSTALNHVITNASGSRNSDISSPFLAQPPSLLAFNQSSSSLGRAEFTCDKSRYGEPSYDSCMEAYSWIPRGKGSLRYGDRTRSDNPDVPLPLRYSSSDGTCIIELRSSEPGGLDLWSPGDLRGVAFRLIKKCMPMGDNEGGSAIRLGQRGGLSMWIMQWKPYAECSSPEKDPPEVSACKNLLNKLPTSAVSQIFGARGTENVDVPLPIKYSDSDFVCTVEISITGPPVTANWYGIWTSAVSIVAMCVRYDKEGVSIGESGDTEITIRLWNENSADAFEAVA